MKTNKIILSIAGIFFIAFSACEKEVLNKESMSTFTENDIWNDIELAEKIVITAYGGLGGWGWPDVGAGGFLSTATDDGFMLFNYGFWPMATGTIDGSNLGAFSGIWSESYDNIRRVNMFLARIDEVPEADPERIERLKGEMKFIRAKEYADLIRFFGGVPLITEVYGLDDDFNVSRDSYHDVVNFIVKELDEAKEMVLSTASGGDWGRVTKGAVLALKSQVLLYAASKLHDPSTSPSGPLFDYESNDKWQQASDAAKAVIDLNQHSLVSVDTWEDYTQIFLNNNSEIIFARPYSSEYSHPNIDKINTPNGYHGWSGNLPTQDLVNAFEMANGQMIHVNGSGYDPNNPYEGRDPRFYADIVYQGAFYRGRETEFYLPGGLDSRDGPEAWNYAVTGYTMRKFMDESIDLATEMGSQPYIYFRLAEIYLNYAEAQFHLGNEDVAREYVNKIRKRVDMPEINTSGSELLDDIRHERRIELVFEGHRFFDLRRWQIADTQLDINIKGVEWVKLPDGSLEYEAIAIQERRFEPRMYYLPIPLLEINKTDLQQNPGY